MAQISPQLQLFEESPAEVIVRPAPAASSFEAQPFLKWVGGKGKLLAQFEKFFPPSISSYVEPFLGGGAVFFRLKAQFPNMQASLRDKNPELINCYQVVRDQVKELMASLDAHLARFRSDSKSYYYQVRSQHHLTEPVERAARMIFLNKTCYNGLWRVNARGEFNVPMGSYRPEKVTLYDSANLIAASRELKDVELTVADFRDTLSQAPAKSFAYIDPPYYPISPTANFTSYTREDFGKAEQEELAAVFAESARRGVQPMQSNSDTPFIRELYRDFKLETVEARRAVNSNGARRGLISELLILGY